MEIVLCGRNVEVPQHFREHTAEKLSRVERYDHKIIRVDVELSHEPNPRRAKNCQRVEITGRGRGPVVRGEACAADFYCALDQAIARLETRLRRAHDRRRVHHGRRVPISVARATGATATLGAVVAGTTPTITAAGSTALLDDVDTTGDTDTITTNGTGTHGAHINGTHTNGSALAHVPAARTPLDDRAGDRVGDGTTDGTTTEVLDDGLPDDLTAWDPPEDDDHPVLGRIARRKEHHAVPMSVDDALSQMELVGHDFFLFADAATGRPSVVYRRHGYDYGVIALA